VEEIIADFVTEVNEIFTDAEMVLESESDFSRVEESLQNVLKKLVTFNEDRVRYKTIAGATSHVVLLNATTNCLTLRHSKISGEMMRPFLTEYSFV